ncbi:aldehyde dehydrogenase family protein [Erythrobacter sp. HL-111]|uniref:aldehyde dehydrogenase family protein n=1 Tax=Erythrobacter sp. HL-111 TaxID=1798193 RepID=UPI0006D9E53E|nr:aldehyde dehydrogenase family protein [Erythrobacter sp. HL-111]KPP92611.1 MAG: aldehyde dehydrogenase (NAD+) [Erythrobacteraceae bacterium HL-111]SDS94378.1 aldehyde dehydrogenase (NAD+) [Erythrobacter sp. HL-111]
MERRARVRFDGGFAMTIGGGAHRAARALPVINPATGQPFAEAPDARPDDLDAAVAAARGAFAAWAATPHGERARMVRELADAVEADADPLAALLTREQGKPIRDAAREVAGLVSWLRAAAGFAIPREVHEDSGTRYCETRRVPIGVVAAIAPWNYPLLLAAFKLGPALVTGNTVVMKPSPFTPLATLKLGEIARGILPPGVLNVVSGGDQLGPWLTAHRGIDKIAFTGSTATGRDVMRSAADGLKRLTLELGGNDPAIVMHDVDPAGLAKALFWASFGNSGQVCVASKRVYVHAGVHDAVRDALVEYAAGVTVGDGMDEATMLGPVNNRRQYDRLLDLWADCRASGLAFACGAEVPQRPGHFLNPAIIDNPPDTARIVQEEQFGPILPLLRFDDYDEAVARANASPFALGATVWAGDEEAGWALGERLRAGNVWVNECRPLSPLVPFAGHGQSGFGVENGLEGLLEYTLPRTMSRVRPIAASR